LKLTKVVYFGLSLLIAGCSSAPTPTNYYLLNNQPLALSVNSVINPEEKQSKTIFVFVKDFPEYLEQPHLVMQMGDHKLHYANFHMWAEPLKQGFQKALLADLSSRKLAVEFIAYDRNFNQKNLQTLFVNIDFFHASANSEVMLAGQYWFVGSNKNKHFKNQPFSFKLQLEKNGYPHSVEKMRSLVSKLAKNIIDGI